MNNIFENAYFGKAYKTRDGKKAIYHGSKIHKSRDGKIWTYHYLMTEPMTINLLGKDVVVNLYDAYINDDGIGRCADLKYDKDSGVNAEYDIISEWEEPIDEEKLNELAEETYPYEYTTSLYASEEVDYINELRDAFKLGCRKWSNKI